MYEAYGGRGMATLTLLPSLQVQIANVRVVDLLERPLNMDVKLHCRPDENGGGRIQFLIKPYQVLTLQIDVQHIN